jgi:iron complex outermembrane receptor protein
MSTVSRGALALVAAATFSPAAWADEAQPAQVAYTDQVIVVGHSVSPISVEPRGLSVSLGQTEFDAINAVNVEDLMKYAPNFFVRKRYIGDANAVPGFRGTHSTQSARSMVLVDGFVVSDYTGNSFSFPPKWGVVGPGEVQQFDVVYGPYSARYSGNTMGGLVSITTRPPVGPEAFATVQGFAQPYRQYGTKDTYSGFTLEAGAGFRQENGPLAGRFSVRHLDNVGQPMQFSQLVPATGAGVPVTGAVSDPALITPTPVGGAYAPDHTVQDQLRARLDYDAGGWTASALFTLWVTDSDLLGSRTYLRDAAGNPVYDGTVSVGGKTYVAGAGLGQGLTGKTEMLGGLKLAGPLAGWDVTVNLSHYWIARMEARKSDTYTAGIGNGPGTVTDQGTTGWWTGDLLAERTFGAHDVAIGMSANLYETAQDNDTTADWRTLAGRAFSTSTFGRTTLVGGFAEDKIALSDVFSVTGGLRYESWRAFAGGLCRQVAGAPVCQRYGNRSQDALSPKLSAQWEAVPGWQLQLSLATATRFPTVGELFQGKLDALGNFDPNSFDPNLKPEKSRDANLILRHDFGNVRVTGSLFWQEVHDAIFSVQGFNQNGIVTTSFKNIDTVRQYGAELILEATDVLVPGLDVDANLAWIDAKTIRNDALPASEGVRFPRIPAWRVNGNLRYAITPALKASVGLRYASRPNTDLLGLQRGDTYGYTSELLILDLRLTWDVSEHVQMSAGIDNVTNDRAWVFHPYPQRTGVVELKWRM